MPAVFFLSGSPSILNISSSLNPKPPITPQSTPTPSKHEFSVSKKQPLLQSNAAIKMPTAPWMKGPLLLQPHEVVDLSKPDNKKSSNNAQVEKADTALTQKVGLRGRRAVDKIVRSVEKLADTESLDEFQKDSGEFGFGDCLEQLGEGEDSRNGRKMPWERDEEFILRRTKKVKAFTEAELRLDSALLERLRGEAARMRKWVKVKKAGVTQGVVDEIRMVWRRDELVMLKFDVPLCRNMDRAREIVEIKTGGLVVWSKKNALVVYRGSKHQSSLNEFLKTPAGFAGSQEVPYYEIGLLKHEKDSEIFRVSSTGNGLDERTCRKESEGKPLPSGIFLQKDLNSQPVSGSLYDREMERLLDGLGPRYIDWWMHKPLPVDADLLPEVVPGFTSPFRLCPPHTRAKLTDNEFTYLRKLAQSLPTHFVVGRNRKLQGLAAAILKLWEKSLIVKIAVKWGIPNTNNEQMAYELKNLTGGVLLLRNKFLIIFYRGKDFLPGRIANLVAERETELKRCQLHEEAARLKAAEAICADNGLVESTITSGTLIESQYIESEFRDLKRKNTESDIKLEAEKKRLERELRQQERKLFIVRVNCGFCFPTILIPSTLLVKDTLWIWQLNSKIEKSMKELSKLNGAWAPAEQEADREMITEEERRCFLKTGLKMDSFLVLGRRGVFDGVIEGLHQQWKYREVVKVITKQRLLHQVIYTAKMLEAESGGILVSVNKLKDGHAIIIYRGKNYRRPLKLVPDNLLSKREALHRSVEMQRVGSLRFFAYQRQQAITDLKRKLADLGESKREFSQTTGEI